MKAKYWNICNECANVWEAKMNCPCCGSADFDMHDDPARFNGGLDSDC